MPSVWDNVEIVEVRLPTCPYCGSIKYAPIRGTTDEDGGRTSRRICDQCGRRYIVLTLPSFGSDDLDVL